MITYKELRSKYISYFKKHGHTEIKAAPLVLQGDATTLFTSSGMQPLVPYLSGKESHPKGKRLVNIQPCIRTADIEEVGDNRHTTFFEMMGNWSIGDYFKEDQLKWKWDFFTQELGLPAEKLYVTIFKGSELVGKDTAAFDIWKSLGVKDDHIYMYDEEENWWSRSGPPSKMPAGEIGGPDSEVFYDFGDGPHDGPASDEDRFLEIGNSVFIQFVKNKDSTLSELPLKNVDFGGGLERMIAAVEDQSDVFQTSFFKPLVTEIESISETAYQTSAQEMRIIADHMRGAAFLIDQGIKPSNKEHGYVLRRFIRRSAVKMYVLQGSLDAVDNLKDVIQPVIDMYDGVYFTDNSADNIESVLTKELKRFEKTIEKGLREIKKMDNIDGKAAFDLFQTYGFPYELTEELAAERDIVLDRKAFDEAQEAHRKLSRSASAGKFKGGLADKSDQVVRYHTATHLLHQALKDVFGDIIRQEGSNITQERLRFDVRLDRKPTDEEVQNVQQIINEKISAELPVQKKVMKRNEAHNIGAAAFFREKYSDEVSVYFIGGNEPDYSDAYSKEFCGGPHVKNTSEIGKLDIYKVKKIGAQLVRFYAR